MTLYEKVKSMNPRVPWNKIEVGKRYHVPPVMSSNRFDLIVKFVNDRYFTYEKCDRSGSSAIVIDYMYPEYMSYYLMTEKKEV